MTSTPERFCEGVDESGNEIHIVDRRAADLTARARRHDRDILAFVRDNPLFEGLEDNQRFLEEYSEALRLIRDGGVRPFIEGLQNEPDL